MVQRFELKTLWDPLGFKSTVNTCFSQAFETSNLGEDLWKRMVLHSMDTSMERFATLWSLMTNYVGADASEPLVGRIPQGGQIQ